jgi:hypothetical protein
METTYIPEEEVIFIFGDYFVSFIEFEVFTAMIINIYLLEYNVL